ncbi:hypothetical protein LR48_Vigan10g188100 [Vigna angularis]|uniref:Uncharacterized protein n=1 Tax=Phaseolus angularis TaxID=3914 RepID=A0A0L9VMP7_PHAAN|nr:hypothetical protein LR48_Vigan10g188100 [Vigna angularis]
MATEDNRRWLAADSGRQRTAADGGKQKLMVTNFYNSSQWQNSARWTTTNGTRQRQMAPVNDKRCQTVTNSAWAAVNGAWTAENGAWTAANGAWTAANGAWTAANGTGQRQTMPDSRKQCRTAANNIGQ